MMQALSPILSTYELELVTPPAKCNAMDPMCLKLLSDIAERSPVALWSSCSTDTFMTLLRGSVEKVQKRNCTMEQLESSVGALCQIGIAYERAKRVMEGGERSNEIESALLAQLQERCTDVDSNSPASQLGQLFLPAALDALTSFATSSSTQASQLNILSSCMSHISACSEQCPSLLAGNDQALTALLRSFMAIAQIPSQEDEEIAALRLSALEIIATVCSVPQIKRMILKPVGKSPTSVAQPSDQPSPMLQYLIQGNEGNGDQKGVLFVCAELIVTGADDDLETWADDPALILNSESSWDNDCTALHAETLLESFVENLGGASTLPAIFQLVDLLLATPSWRNQRAVLSMLERCLAAAPVTFVPHISATVDAALNLVQSDNVRVQYQALQLIGSLCCANTVESEEGAKSDCPVLVRENYAAQILESVARHVSSPCTKVAAHACLAIVSYCRGGNGSNDCLVPIDKDLVLPYVGTLLESLKTGPLSVDLSQPSSINEGTVTVLIRAIGAVACLANASGPAFLPHYSIMSGLTSCATFGVEIAGQTVTVSKNGHEMSMLRGSAIEAATIVGQAISGEDGENVGTYVNDAGHIMTIASTVLNSGISDIIPMDQLLAACARIAAVMEGQYVQYMPSVLPHLLNKATEKLDVSVTDADESNSSVEEEDGFEGYSVSVPGMGRKKIRINTTQLEEKAQSARALYEHARSLGADFGPFVEVSVNSFLPLVNCEYSGDVRATAAQALCQVFKAACLAASNGMQNNAQKLLPIIATALAKQLEAEGDDDIDHENRFAIADALSEVMYDSFTQTSATGGRVAQITVSDGRLLTDVVMSLIKICLSRRSTLISEMGDYSFDNDQIARCEDKVQAEADYLTHLVDSVGYSMKSLGQQYAPIFAQYVAEPLGVYLNSSRTSDLRARLSAVCLFDDCVEHCGAQAASTFAPMLLSGIRDALNEDGVLDSDIVELKQAALYGLSQVSRHAPAAIHPDVGQDLLTKAYIIANTNKETTANISLVENAVSCIASLALFEGASLARVVADKSPLASVFLQGLPLEQDFDEAKVRSDQLSLVKCQLYLMSVPLDLPRRFVRPGGQWSNKCPSRIQLVAPHNRRRPFHGWRG